MIGTAAAARCGRHGCPSMRQKRTVMAPALALMALGACAPSVPDSAAGVGFGDPGSYLARQQAQAAPTGLVPPRQVVSLPPQPYRTTVPVSAAPPASEAQSIASAAVASVRPDDGAATRAPVPPAAQGGRETGEAAQHAFGSPPGWSAENPNVTAYALATTHRVGTPRHQRSRLTLQNSARNCAQFASADLAQEEFLRRGGPERDPLNLDPDGDGFACGWSPEPFRAAARAAD